MRFITVVALLVIVFTSCSKSNPAPSPTPPTPPINPTMYFPPTTSNAWETTDPSTLGWNSANLPALYNFLAAKNTKAFIVLKQGKIVLERYFGTFTADSVWYWASAGKTVTATLVGIAQQEGLLNINQRSNLYLGTGWSSLTPTQENQITVQHHLTMTTGLNDNLGDDDCTSPACLQYLAPAGTRWAYHNGPYTLLEKVVENATSRTFNQYYQQKLGASTGMTGLWIRSGFNNVLFSTPRTMARFGLLLLNRGNWNGTSVLSDTAYFRAMTSSSQTLNNSYGYLTWLNGKTSHMLPQVRTVFPGMLTPTGPADMYAGLGKNDQKVYVVPSQQLVVIRMGDSAGNVQLAVSSFDSELWSNLRQVIPF